MKDIHYITDIESLRVISDALRVDILLALGNTPKSGQELSKELKESRSKIHYHLNELEKKGFVEVVKTDVVNGIIQKFYLPVAKAFIPDITIFNNDFFQGYKEVYIDPDEFINFKEDIEKVLSHYQKENTDKTKKISIYIGE